MTPNEQLGRQDAALELVDLHRYPIDALHEGAGAELLADCTTQMKSNGWCNLEGFIRPEALKALAQESNRLLPSAESLTITRNIYGQPADPSTPATDPRGHELEHRPLQLANDQLPPDALIQQLYDSELLTDFVRRVQGKQRLYRYADEFQALNVIALTPGNWHAWHYDHNECTVTLLLQAAERGGEFSFIPNSRTRQVENREVVSKLLAGDMSQAQSFDRDVGTLTLFRGEYSLHGVTEVRGSLPRVTAIFTYDEEPDRVASDEINIRIYGTRVKRLLAEKRASQATVRRD